MKRLFYFNPENEMAIANGSHYYSPPANILRFSQDLAFLPAYFAENNDSILLNTLPSDSFIANYENIFGKIPDLYTWDRLEELSNLQVEPWGWSPRVQYLFKNILENKEYDFDRELYSRKTASCFLKQLILNVPYIEDYILPHICYMIDEVTKLVDKGNFVIKSPWSSSGKGQIRINNKNFYGKTIEWIEGIIKKQQYIMVEKELCKIINFAMSFYIDNNKVNFLGYSLFDTRDKGEYLGNYLYSQQKIESILKNYIPVEQLYKIQEELIRLFTHNSMDKYKGYVGVDMMIYKNEREEYKIQPCVEINWRYTMGILAFFLYKRFIRESRKGMFSINFYKEPQTALKHHTENMRLYPLKKVDGKIDSGYINLTPVENNTLFVASMKIEAQN